MQIRVRAFVRVQKMFHAWNIKRKGRGNTKTKTKAEDKTNNANQNDKKNKTEKQKKVKLKWRPMEKLEPGAKPPSFDGR